MLSSQKVLKILTNYSYIQRGFNECWTLLKIPGFSHTFAAAMEILAAKWVFLSTDGLQARWLEIWVFFSKLQCLNSSWFINIFLFTINLLLHILLPLADRLGKHFQVIQSYVIILIFNFPKFCTFLIILYLLF